MSYNKIGFTKGQILKAEHLNHMEEGIANAGGSGGGKLYEHHILLQFVDESATKGAMIELRFYRSTNTKLALTFSNLKQYLENRVYCQLMGVVDNGLTIVGVTHGITYAPNTDTWKTRVSYMTSDGIQLTDYLSAASSNAQYTVREV